MSVGMNIYIYNHSLSVDREYAIQTYSSTIISLIEACFKSQNITLFSKYLFILNYR